MGADLWVAACFVAAVSFLIGERIGRVSAQQSLEAAKAVAKIAESSSARRLADAERIAAISGKLEAAEASLLRAASALSDLQATNDRLDQTVGQMLNHLIEVGLIKARQPRRPPAPDSELVG